MNPCKSVSRSSRSLFAASAVFLSAVFPTFAQVKPAAAEAGQADNKETLELSVYKVTSTQDTGYAAKSATPFKTKQQIVDIPQAITLVTRDLIDDIGEFDSPARWTVPR